MAVGAALQQVRVERKLSLADVTRETKIQPWVLEALEADRLHELMSPIYVRGFLTTYAKFLRLEPEALVAQLPRLTSEPDQETLPPPAPAALTFRPSLPLLRRLGAAVAAVAVVAAIVAINPMKHWKTVHVSLPKLTLPKLARKPLAAPKVASRKVTTPTVAMPSITMPKLASVTPLKEPGEAAALPSLALVPTQPLQLEVSANSTTWIQVRADGKLLTQQRLLRGANERWIAKKRFELIVAKPSQVELRLNGQPIGPFAIAHRGRLLITHRGVTQLPAEER